MGKVFGNVFDAIESDIEVVENLKIRSWLMIAIETHISKNNLTQEAAAKLMGVSQPRISDLIRGKIELFTIDKLINMLTRVGVKVNLALGTISKNSEDDISKAESFTEAAYTIFGTPVYDNSDIYIEQDCSASSVTATSEIQ